MPVNVPGVIGPAFSPMVTPSAPCTSLLNTLPLRVSRVSDAVEALLSFTPRGRSSTIFTSNEPVVVVPLSSTAVTVNCSGRVLAPLALGCASLSLRV
ncbi:hypothetical protein D3C71_1311840 [compost metagenome]